MQDFKSHFRDFLAYCTRPVSVHLAMASVGYSFNSFSIFVLSLRQQNLIELCFPVSVFQYAPPPPPPPPPHEKLFYTGKLYGLTGMQMYVSKLFSYKAFFPNHSTKPIPMQTKTNYTCMQSNMTTNAPDKTNYLFRSPWLLTITDTNKFLITVTKSSNKCL